MGYDIGWAILGTEPLAAEELALLHAHVTAWAPRIMDYDLSVPIAAQPEVQAAFSLRPSRNPDVEVDEEFYGSGAFGFAMDVVEEIFEALEEMRELVPRHEVVIQDDFHGFRWTGTGFDIVNDVSIADPGWNDPGWVALGTLSLQQVNERFADRQAAPANKSTKKSASDDVAVDLSHPGSRKWAETKKARKANQKPWDGRGEWRGPIDWGVNGPYFAGPWAEPEPTPDVPFFAKLDAAQAAAIAEREAAPAPAPVEPAAPSTKTVARSKQPGLVDELIEMVISERTRVTPFERQKYHLDLPGSPSRYDIRDAIARSLSIFFTDEAADLLLDNAEKWMGNHALCDVAQKVFERAAQTPERIARVKALWARTVEESNRSRDLNDYLRPYAPVLFDAAVEILRAPLPSLDWDACGTAIDIVSRASARGSDAVSVLTACMRRDRRHTRWERVRDRAIDALERLADPRSAATGLIEMSQSDQRSSACVRLVARDPEHGLAMLERMRDCAGFADYAVISSRPRPIHWRWRQRRWRSCSIRSGASGSTRSGPSRTRHALALRRPSGRRSTVPIPRPPSKSASDSSTNGSATSIARAGLPRLASRAWPRRWHRCRRPSRAWLRAARITARGRSSTSTRAGAPMTRRRWSWPTSSTSRSHIEDIRGR